MPFNHQMNSNLVDRNDIHAKRGIFRNRPKLSSNVVAIKPNRHKLQSKIHNRHENDLKVELPQAPEANGRRHVVKIPSIQLAPNNYLLSVSEASAFALGQSDQSLMYRVERCKLDQTSPFKKLLSNCDSSVNIETETIPSHMSLEATPKGDSFENATVQEEAQNEYVLWNRSPSQESQESNTFTMDDVEDDSSEKLTVADHIKITNYAKTITTSQVNNLRIGDSSHVSLESKRADLLESELKTYSASLKKYDQEAKDVIAKFTESLNEKGKIIKKYEEQLSLFNTRVSRLQTQLEESLERTKQMESIAVNAATSHLTVDLKSENEKLKEFVKILETKLAKRELHIHNLKEVLTLETKKIKELNKAQVEINQLERDNIDKSRVITVLRDELKCAAKMRSELTMEYEEKIVKLKKLLAIREYLLIKGKS